MRVDIFEIHSTFAQANKKKQDRKKLNPERRNIKSHAILKESKRKRRAGRIGVKYHGIF